MPESKTPPAPGTGRHTRINAGLTAILLIILLLLMLSAAYMLTASMHSDPYTELYLLGQSGKADNYPYLFNVSEPRPVTVGVANHEHRNMAYDLVVTLENSTKDYNGTQNYTLYQDRITLPDNGTWVRSINISPPVNGTRMKLAFRLFANGNMAVPYRDCFLYITVETPWVPPGAILVNNTMAIK